MCAICDFKIEFSVGHPQALTVAVATRTAIETDLLRPVDTEGVLAQARLKMTAVDTLNSLQTGIQDALSIDEILKLPDFYVLLIESDTWGFFHATVDGFDPDIVPDLPDVLSENAESRSLVIVTSQVALQTWLDHEMEVGQLIAQSLACIDGPPEQCEKLLSTLTASAQAMKAEALPSA